MAQSAVTMGQAAALLGNEQFLRQAAQLGLHTHAIVATLSGGVRLVVTQDGEGFHFSLHGRSETISKVEAAIRPRDHLPQAT